MDALQIRLLHQPDLRLYSRKHRCCRSLGGAGTRRQAGSHGDIDIVEKIWVPHHGKRSVGHEADAVTPTGT